MRMWMVNPRLLCPRHLLGEHLELHMLVGTLRKGRSISGFLRDGLVEVQSVRQRHRELAEEMASRGMNHQSPLPAFHARRAGRVDIPRNLRELARRCPDCRARQRAAS